MEKKICKQCGASLPIKRFASWKTKKGLKRRDICSTCYRQNMAVRYASTHSGDALANVGTEALKVELMKRLSYEQR